MMNSQNNPVHDPVDVPFYLDTLDPDFVAWITSLDPQDKQLFADMLGDTAEMLDEGYESPDIHHWLRRNYGGPRVY